MSYYIGDNLPSFLMTYFESNCDADSDCIKNGAVAGTFFLYLALTTFTFIPKIFSKLNENVNPSYSPSYIKEKQHEPVQVQWLTIRLLALVLNFDSIYSALWNQAIVTVGRCTSGIIIGSAVSILIGWITWSIYAVCYSYNLDRIKQIVMKFKNSHKNLLGKHYVLEMMFYCTILLTYFPIHIMADNNLPLSCSCLNTTDTTSSAANNNTVCDEPHDVVLTRVVLLSYETVLLTALTILALIKFNLKETKHI